jgi:hypothetical protein
MPRTWKLSHPIFIAVVALLLTPLTSIAGGVQKDEMNDRFAVETFDPPARGFVKTATTQDGSIEILKVQVHDLAGGRDYGVVATVSFLADGCDPNVFNPQAVVESDPITANEDGHLVLKDFFVGNFPAGDYRVDILVVNAGDGIGGDFLLACEPFPCVTVE